MTTYNVVWSVKETVNGPGEHDGGVRDGDVNVLAQGTTQREGDPSAMYDELMALLRETWPPESVGPTYDLIRTYEIDIREV